MKGLWKVLSPFAPDQSGAAAVFYALGGMIIILDAGGCAGNICGFDEPRWAAHKSAIFSAGLRDMDAILGRDDKLVEKLSRAAAKLDARFIALIGTPVPSVIGTDYRALRRMAEARTGLPVLTVDTTGMERYDVGAEKAYLALAQRFAERALPVEKGRVNVWGLTPLDFGAPDAAAKLTARLHAEGYGRVCCCGLGSLDDLATASAAELNLVVAPCGLKAAQFLRQKFGTPYLCRDPLADAYLPEKLSARRALVVHQQVRANELRRLLKERGVGEVAVATWFLQKPELACPGDVRLAEEDQLAELLRGGYDLLVGDEMLWGVGPDGGARHLDVPHFAVSGRTEGPWS